MKEETKSKITMLFWSVFLFFFGIILLISYMKNTLLWEKTLSWPSVKGTIKNINFVDHSDADSPAGTSFIVKLQYSYQVEGKSYTSKQINQGVWHWMVDQKGRKWFEENSKVGTQVEVFYNPTSPSEAILIRGKTGCEHQTLALAIIMILAGVTFLIIVIKCKDTTNC
jgi:uncharacterized protein DUF3592